ncbi:hypothetical protein ANANG_G00080060 [Anguilla anguilla]|uniref:Mitochondrial fission regulator n=1 Tax=Anguilla anguilla TaxID=7936 RepID=A0A9D3MJV0_ANGAN|nr:hypothetical protein ANANG_G00080060 [Anguilla anguilla]
MTREHAGIEMDLAFGSVKPYGSSRSIVRRIATSLPLKPCPVFTFSFILIPKVPAVSTAPLSRMGLWPRSRMWPGSRGVRATPPPDSDSTDRIGPGADRPACCSCTSWTCCCPSTTWGLHPHLHHPLPSPSPSTPTAPPGLQRSVSAIDLIRERRGKKTSTQTALDPGPKQPEIPSMLDVLKDMGKVKLRSVKSRPEDGLAKPKPSDPTDAASLIAEALKRKFAHRYRSESWSESWSESDFGHPAPRAESPQTPPRLDSTC